MDAGHTAENVYLQCFSLGLGTVAMGGFDEEEAKEILEMDEECEPIA